MGVRIRVLPEVVGGHNFLEGVEGYQDGKVDASSQRPVLGTLEKA
jgi:hypothetical protein